MRLHDCNQRGQCLSRPTLCVSSSVDASMKLLQVSSTYWLNFAPKFFCIINLTIRIGVPSLSRRLRYSIFRRDSGISHCGTLMHCRDGHDKAHAGNGPPSVLSQRVSLATCCRERRRQGCGDDSCNLSRNKSIPSGATYSVPRITFFLFIGDGDRQAIPGIFPP